MKKRTKLVLGGFAGASVLLASCVLGVVSCASGGNSNSSDNNSTNSKKAYESVSQMWSNTVGSSNLLTLNTSYTFSDLMNILANWSAWMNYYTTMNPVNTSAWNSYNSSELALQFELYGLSSNLTTAIFNTSVYGGNAPSNEWLEKYGISVFSNEQIVGMCYLLSSLFAQMIANPTANASTCASYTASISNWSDIYDLANKDNSNALPYGFFNIFGYTPACVQISSNVQAVGINLQSLLSMFSAWLPTSNSYAQSYLSSYLTYVNTQNIKAGTEGISYTNSYTNFSPDVSSSTTNASSLIGSSYNWTPYLAGSVDSSNANYNYLYAGLANNNTSSNNTNNYIFGTSSNPFQTPNYVSAYRYNFLSSFPAVANFLYSNLTSNTNNTLSLTSNKPTLNTFGNFTIPNYNTGFQSNFFISFPNWDYYDSANGNINATLSSLSYSPFFINSNFMTLLNNYSTDLSSVGLSNSGNYLMYLGINLLNGSGDNEHNTNDEYTFSNIASVDNGYNIANSSDGTFDVNNLYPTLAILGLTNQAYANDLNFTNVNNATAQPFYSFQWNTNSSYFTTSSPLTSWNEYLNLIYNAYYGAYTLGQGSYNYGGLLTFPSSVTSSVTTSNALYSNATEMSVYANNLANSIQTMLQTYYKFYSNIANSSNSVPFATIRIFNNYAYNSTQYYPITLYINKTSQLPTYPNNDTKAQFDTQVKDGYTWFQTEPKSGTYDNVGVVQGDPSLSNFYYITYKVGSLTSAQSVSNTIANTQIYSNSSSNAYAKRISAKTKTKTSNKNIIKIHNLQDYAKLVKKSNSINNNPILATNNKYQIVKELH